MISAAQDAVSPDTVQALERGLGRVMGRPLQILSATASPLPEKSSFPIDRIDVTTNLGEHFSAIRKWVVLGGERGHGRELHVYRHLLDGGRLGAPMLYASGYDASKRCQFLLLEDLGGQTLTGDAAVWTLAIELLAEVHATFAHQEDELVQLGFLELHDEGFYRSLARRARANLAATGSRSALGSFDSMMRDFDALVAYLVSQPRTLVHGDVFRHNLILQSGPIVRLIDWDSAGIGLGELDLARLIDGWGLDRERFIAAYSARRTELNASLGTGFSKTFAACDVVRSLLAGGWSAKQPFDPAFPRDFLKDLATAWRRVGAIT